MAFLELDRLTKRYGGHLAVDTVSLSVQTGEFVSLLGPSGCGKTTTLQMIAGFVEPSAGNIRVDRQDLTRVKAAKRGLGLVFQSYALFPHMTAAENIAFGLEMRRIRQAEREKSVQGILSLVGLSGLADRYPRQLSGGQRQRVALARALVIRPRILLLDEPLSNLDAKLREGMQEELRRIQRHFGTTTILVTHDQQEALALSDRIAVMNAGRVEQIGAPRDVYQAPASAFVASFLGKTNILNASIEIGSNSPEAVPGDLRIPAPQTGNGAVSITIRPEKVFFADTGLLGKVVTRTFQGAYWLFRISTAAGEMSVIRQNSGGAIPAEGDTVYLAWDPADAIIASKPGVQS